MSRDFKPVDSQTLSPGVETMLEVAEQLAEGSMSPERLAACQGVLAAWLQREAYLAAGDATQNRTMGMRNDVAEALSEDNPGYLLARTFVYSLMGVGD